MRYLFFLLFLFYSWNSTAQTLDVQNNQKEKFFVGLSTNTISYHIYYKNRTTSGEVRSGYFTPLFIHFGYNLSARASLQLGLGYGGDNDKRNFSIKGASGSDVVYNFESRTQVVAIPLTVRYTFLNANKKLPLFGVASLLPAFGRTKSIGTENHADISTIIHNAKDRGVNIFATAGLGFNYKIKNHFSGYTELLLFKKNLTGDNSFYYDWEYGHSLTRRLFKSLGLGINYNL